MALIDWHDLALFEDWRPEEVSSIVNAITGERHVAEGDVVCAEDVPARHWWIVAEGSADVTVQGIYVGTIGAGETIGEVALIDRKPSPATSWSTISDFAVTVAPLAFPSRRATSPIVSPAPIVPT